jgi:hypothetical protein
MAETSTYRSRSSATTTRHDDSSIVGGSRRDRRINEALLAVIELLDRRDEALS